MLQVLAAEVAAGASLTVAWNGWRAAWGWWDGSSSSCWRRANAFRRDVGVHNQPGGLQLAARAWGSTSLYSLAAQLDTIHTQGIEGAETLALLAKSVSLRELGEARRQAENLDSELVLPLALLFFAPFTAAILAPVIAMLVTLF
jgi:hypothetical protein